MAKIFQAPTRYSVVPLSEPARLGFELRISGFDPIFPLSSPALPDQTTQRAPYSAPGQRCLMAAFPAAPRPMDWAIAGAGMTCGGSGAGPNRLDL
jgi:hypothetical protein